MASVVVVGGGLAGLSCARRLARAGHQVQVLEARAAVGGRARSDSDAQGRWDPAGAVLRAGDTNLRLLAEELGLGARLVPLASGPPRVLEGASLRLWPLASLAELRRARDLPWRTRLALAAELGRGGRRATAEGRPPDALDAIPLSRVLVPRLGREGVARLVDPALRARLDTDADSVSAAFGLACLRAWSGRSGEAMALSGGLTVLVGALADRVVVRTGCEVVRVETARDGARVRYRTARREGSVLGDAVVMAVAPPRAVALCPGLVARERRALAAMEGSRGIGVSLRLEKQPPADAGYEWWIPAGPHGELRAVYLSHRRAGLVPRGAGLLDVVLASEASERLWWASDEHVLECALEGLAATPIGRPAPVAFRVWRHDPHLPRFGPGALARRAAFLRRHVRTPRLAFASDALVSPDLEGAVTSGMRAATEIARELRERTLHRVPVPGVPAASA